MADQPNRPPKPWIDHHLAKGRAMLRVYRAGNASLWIYSEPDDDDERRELARIDFDRDELDDLTVGILSAALERGEGIGRLVGRERGEGFTF